MPFQLQHSPTTSTPTLKIPAIGLELAVRLPQSDSDGSLVILETTNAPGFGPPLHRHRETEIFRVLEGEYLYEVDGKRFHASAGDLVTVPGGVPHTFTNLSPQPAHQIVLMLPAMDALAFFTGLGDLMAAGRPDPATLNAYGARWGVEFLGSPLSATS
jgi:mannose-6-phosphate isomerase-like protein (cupin superfamily)